MEFIIMPVFHVDAKTANNILSKIKARFEETQSESPKVAVFEKPQANVETRENRKPKKGQVFVHRWYPEYHSPNKQLQGHKNVLIAREQEQEDW